MRYQEAHAAKSGSVPFALRGRKSLRTALSVAVAGIIGLAPSVLVSSPAVAGIADLTINNATVLEGGDLEFTWSYSGLGETFDITVLGSGTATDTDDFATFAPISITPVTSDTGTIIVDTALDSIGEGDETVILQVQEDNGGATTTATGTITDDDSDLTLTNTPTAAEGGNLSFAYSYAGAAATYTVAVTGGSATSGDYDTFTTTLGPLANGDTGNIVIPIVDDPNYEAAETLTITVSTNDNLGDSATATGTISASDNAGLAISNASAVTEGGVLTFPYTYSGPGGATFTIAASGGTTLTSGDYTAPTATLGPLADGASGNITVQTTNDTLHEIAETLTITATGSGGPFTATGTINDSGDPAPTYTLSASPATVTEGSGAKSTITATLSGASGVETVVELDTSNGTATTANNDFTPLTNEPITIAAGDLTGSADVIVGADAKKDQLDTESFTVTGSSDDTLAPGTASTTVNIADAQATPKLTLSSSGTVNEGGNATFTVTSDTESELPITVQWNAVDVTPTVGSGSATPGTDFTYPGSRTVIIPAGDLTTTITVPVSPDSADEPNEEFAIELASPVNAALGTTTRVTKTIVDTNDAPTVTITPTAVTEGNTGRRAQSFTATLSAASNKTVKATWSTGTTGTGSGHAVAGKDFAPANGILTFAPGTTTQTFTVDIIGDGVDEGQDPRLNTVAEGETFTLSVAAVVGETPASITAGPAATITITDDDAKPTATFGDVSISEGDEASAVLVPIKLDGASDHDIDLTVALAGGSTAVSTIGGVVGDNDYKLLNTAVTIPAEMSSGYAVVLLNGDMVHENDETVNLTATPDAGDAGATWLSTATADPATLTIKNDDNAPDLEINSITGEEGETVAVTGTVTGISEEEVKLTVSFAGAAADGHQAAGATDFTNPGAAVVTIAPGTLPGTVMPVQSIKLTDDTEAEPIESIVGTGVGLGNIGTVTEGVVSIAANDGHEPGGEEPGGEEPGGEEPGAPTISTTTSTLVGGGIVTFTGKAAANSTVELWGQAMGSEASGMRMASTKADASGNFSVSRWIGQGYVFQTAVGDAFSDNEVTVRVKQNPSLRASSPSRDKVSVTVAGNPKLPGANVTVQNYVNGAWRNLYTAKLGADGTHTRTVTTGNAQIILRTMVTGDADMGILNSSWTALRRVNVK